MRNVLILVAIFLLLISSIILKIQTMKTDQTEDSVKSITKELCASLYYTINDCVSISKLDSVNKMFVINKEV